MVLEIEPSLMVSTTITSCVQITTKLQLVQLREDLAHSTMSITAIDSFVTKLFYVTKLSMN